jgi:cytochrome c oxidase assembly protein subunit 15
MPLVFSDLSHSSRRSIPYDVKSKASERRAIAFWLFGVCAMILVMIALGGATRLTGSGLSIMEWAPFRGALPPVSDPEWQRLFKLYQQIPQYALVNEGFGIEGFKRIFWLEYLHRLWGRLIGLGFLLPMLWFWFRGAFAPGSELRWLRPRVLALFLLGGAQGGVGWFMVASGFAADSTAVSPYRLVVHLMLALCLYAAILWTGLDVLRAKPMSTGTRLGGNAALARRLLMATCVLLTLTILAGGFVAGTHAGLDYNTFPLMDGRLVPAGYARLEPFWRNLTENIAAVQFDHRLLATLTALAACASVVAGLSSGGPRAGLFALAASVALQYALGVATLLAVTELGHLPAGLGTAHQTSAVLVLTAALVALHSSRRRHRPEA